MPGLAEPSLGRSDAGGAVRFSLIVATVGRTEELARLLASLRDQTHQDFELIVVDQNPDDRLAPVLEPYAGEFRILHLRTRVRGASRARNIGLGHASGDVIAFPDDDCRYPPLLLRGVVESLRAHPGLDGVTGRSVGESGENTQGRFAAEPALLGKMTVWRRAIEYTIFVRAGSVRGVCFDEELGVGAGTAWGAGEATDYLLRLVNQGVLLRYDPGIVVIHPEGVPPYDAKARRKAYAYGAGMGRVLWIHDMPLWFKAKWLIRPLGGAVLSLARANRPQAGFRWNTFAGRLRGLASGGERKTSARPSHTSKEILK